MVTRGLAVYFFVRPQVDTDREGHSSVFVMIMNVTRRFAGAGVLLLVGLVSTDAQSVRGLGGGVDRVLSPAVVATWISHRDETGAARLDLLVLWRGSPGWFIQDGRGGGGSAGGSSSRDGATVLTTRIHYGGVDLELRFDPLSRTAQVGGHQIALGDANVILLDAVDSLLRVVGTRRVEPTIPESGRRIELVLRRSSELLEYLRCDVRLPDPKAQEQMEFLCAQVLGRCDVRLENPTLQAMLDVSCLR